MRKWNLERFKYLFQDFVGYQVNLLRWSQLLYTLAYRFWQLLKNL